MRSTALEQQPLDIGVIGGGLAGLAAAWLLGRDHRVTLYERHREPGFTAHSIAVPHAGPGTRVDVPLRVFYPGYYPSLLQLYDELGVATEPVDYATTFSDEQGDPYFRYRNLRWGALSMAYVLPRDVRGLRSLNLANQAWRFHRASRQALAQGRLQGLSLADFLAQGRFEPDFVQHLLLPVVSTICTCPHAAALDFPASVVADYLLQGVTRQAVRRAVHGADDACQRLLQRVAVLRCGADVRGLSRDADGVTVLQGDVPPARHDHVVLAAPAHRALQLIDRPEADERAALGAVQHHAVTVLVHRDAALMPRRRRDWSPVNAAVWPGQRQAQSTIWVNAVQPVLRDAPDLFQTVAPGVSPRDEQVLAEARFERPVVDAHSLRVPERLARLHAQAGRRLWFCGSYAQAGIPLLEAAVGSAMSAVAALQRTARPRA